MKTRNLFLTAGLSYLVIFFTAIFANFFVLDSIKTTPLEVVQGSPVLVGLGIIAFLIAIVFDVVVAWALRELYKDHPLTTLSTYFRLMHAAIFGVSLFALIEILRVDSADEVLSLLTTFNDIWLLGLFFFGIHLLLLPHIIKLPKLIAWMLPLAGLMYMLDTCAHFLLADYENYANLLLALVASTSILGEMAFAIWLFFQKENL